MEVDGETAAGGFAPIIAIRHATVIGSGPLPAAVDAAKAGRSIPLSANVWAVARGRILWSDTRLKPGYKFLTLFLRLENGEQIPVSVALANRCKPVDVVDAEVEVHGILGTSFAGAGNRISNHLLVAGCEAVRILTPPHPDWSLPLKAIRVLLTYRSETNVNDMIRVRGTVTLADSAIRFYIQDGTRGIAVEPVESATALRAGEAVEVLGRIVQDLQGARRIVAARVRPSPTPVPIAIRRVKDASAENGFADTLVCLVGTIVSRELTPERLLLGVQSGGAIVTADLPLAGHATLYSAPEVDDLVEITAIARVRPAFEERNVDVRLALRSPFDIRIVKKRPFYERIPWGRVALGASCVALGAMIWILALRNRVRARTRQLEEARIEAERASRAKGEFLANMSHEIRTPMNGVLAASELALQTGLNGEQRELVETVKTSAESLLTIINDILDVSKIEAGKLTFDPIPFSLRKMMHGAVNAHQVAARKKGLLLSCHIRPDVPEVIVADQTRLAQIVTNLVGNAIKFTASGEVAVFVNLEDLSSEGAQLHFSVRDTGIGIPESQQLAIFEAFSQADASTTRRFGGTGLGLSISSKLVHTLGGKLWVESEMDKGSCFHFTLTLPVGAAALESAPVARVPSEKQPALRILLAEDNLVNQKLAVRLLEKQGHAVTAASDGREAIALFERQAFDLILMDVQMPGMDGFEATAAIREMEKFKGSRIPIVALTAHAMSGDRERCLASGMDGFATKPIRPEDLHNEIRRLQVQAR